MAQMKIRTDIFQVSKVLSEAPVEQVTSLGLVDRDLKGIQGIIKSEQKGLQKMEFFYVFNCNVCSYGTDERIQLEQHKHIHENRLQCDICKKVFKFERSLIRHRQKHGNELTTDKNIYQCDSCNKVYKYERTLNRHIKQHAAESIGLNSNNLVKKEPMVTTIDQLPNNKRAREFNDDKSNIVDEKDTIITSTDQLPPKKRQKEFIDENSNHVDEKSLMNAASTSLQVPYSKIKLEQLNKHNVTLSDVRSGIHKCDFCGKICKYERTLRRHRQKHITDKKIKGIDSKWPLFTPSSQAMYQLPKPMVKLTDIQSHGCSVCHKTYNRKGALTKHMKTVHTV